MRWGGSERESERASEPAHLSSGHWSTAEISGDCGTFKIPQSSAARGGHLECVWHVSSTHTHVQGHRYVLHIAHRCNYDSYPHRKLQRCIYTNNLTVNNKHFNTCFIQKHSGCHCLSFQLENRDFFDAKSHCQGLRFRRRKYPLLRGNNI